ncbi:MAG: nicotinate-nucleotide adenylyltransferase [Thermoleophilia bacterium]
MKLAIMGGTFNPIHLGHLVCAEEAVVQCGFDEILFMPAGTPSHKDVAGGADPESRYLMTVLATVGNPGFRVSRYELDQELPSYTVDTIRHYRQQMPEAEIYFITGADAILEILDWKDPQELLAEATLIAATRPGYSLDGFARRSELVQQGRVQIMEVPQLGISSSLIRERVSLGKSIRYLVPETVERFIEKERLYLTQ